MANIDNGFRIDILTLDGKTLVVSGEDHPDTGPGYDAPQGSLYLRKGTGITGQVYHKFGPSDVDWYEIKTFPGGVGTLQNSSTGIISGGILSINAGDASKFDITAGVGIIVDHDTDPLDSSYILVSWPLTTGVPATSIGVSDGSAVTIDSTGTIQQYTSPSLGNAIHKTEISIGQMGHVIPSTELNAVRGHLDPVHGASERLADLSRAIGPINISGNVYSPNGVNLILDKSSGNTHSVGVGFHSNPTNPDIYDDGPQAIVSFFYSYQDGAGSFVSSITPETAIVPGLWDDGSGTLQAVPGGEWTTQTVHYFSGAEVTRIEYGQQLFSTKEAAQNSLPDPDHIHNPAFEVGVVRAYIVVSGSAIDLSDTNEAVIVEGDKFGGGTGQIHVQNVFGSEYFYAESLGITTVTTTSFQEKLKLTTGIIPPGTYRIGWSYNYNHDSTVDDSITQVQLDDSATLSEIHHRQYDSSGTFGSTGTRQTFSNSGFAHEILTGGVHTIDIDLASSVVSVNTSVWNARLEIWRVS